MGLRAFLDWTDSELPAANPPLSGNNKYGSPPQDRYFSSTDQ